MAWTGAAVCVAASVTRCASRSRVLGTFVVVAEKTVAYLLPGSVCDWARGYWDDTSNPRVRKAKVFFFFFFALMQ